MHVSHTLLTILVGAAALIMTVRELVKLVLINGLVSKCGQIKFRYDYWLHFMATIFLVTFFIFLVTA